MISQNVARILWKKDAPFTAEEIAKMSDNDAWAWICQHDRLRSASKAQAKLPEICFTGFKDSEKEQLRTIAEQAGFVVKDSVTKTLALLVTGENAGSSKLAKAEAQGCTITDEIGFKEYVQSGQCSSIEAEPPLVTITA